jgi:hypothetical protein
VEESLDYIHGTAPHCGSAIAYRDRHEGRSKLRWESSAMDTYPDADSLGCREAVNRITARIWEDGPIGWLTVLTLDGCALYALIFLS